MIDFSALDAISAPSAPTTHEQGGGGKLSTPDPTSANRGNSDGLERLQREADQNKDGRERARDVYKAYQANILAAGTLKSDILKGIDRGESLFNLLLQAGEVIARTTNDSVFAGVLRRKLVEVRGLGLGDPEALDGERLAIEKRLEKLHNALERERGTEQESGIKWAIRAHEQERQRIEKLLEQAKAEAESR